MGNRRVAQLIQAKRLTPEGRIMDRGIEINRIQPKLAVGAADDQYEQEADRVARQVMSMPDASPSFVAGSVQRAGIPGNQTPEEAKKDKNRDKLLQPSRLGSLGTAVIPLAQQLRRQPEEESEKEAALQRSHLANVEAPLQRHAEKKEKKLPPQETRVISRFYDTSTGAMIQRDKIPHGALTWEDFKGKAPKSSKYDAVTYSFFEDPDLGALIPGKAPVDTGEPCRAKGKDQTRFTVDITIDPAQLEIKSLMDQEKSWRRPWTTDEPARRVKCEKEWSPKCEKGFDKQFSKIKKTVSKEKTRCQKELDEKKMKKNAKKQCKPLEDECKSALKGGDASFSIQFDGVEITAATAKECTSIVLAHCVTETLKERTFSVSVDGETATATSKAGCKTEFAPEFEKLLKDQAIWEITVTDETTTIKSREDCRKQLVDDCATDFLETGSNALLGHEQAHFDLTDAMAKKTENDLKELIGTFPVEAEGCGEKAATANAKKLLAGELKKLKKSYGANKELLNKKQAQYDKETNHGTMEKKQAAWEKKINEGF
ncbi:MAG: hypothetical protein NTAFB09_07970 [Nitrosospira sp.]